jgi:hypothetical protein
MLTQYKNIDQIQNAANSLSADRIDKTKTDFFSYDPLRVIPVPDILKQDDSINVEFHVYSNDTWITGNHSIQLESKIPEYRNKETNGLITLPNAPVAINLYNEFDRLKLTSGNFRFVINFFKNLIGNYNRQHLRIDEISPDRTELRLRAIDSDDPEFLRQITNFISTVNQTGETFYKPYVLNFSRNQTALFVNSVVIGDFVYVKLYQPLPDTLDVDFKCWVSEELKAPYVDKVAIAASAGRKKFRNLSNPNWYANSVYNTSTETGLQAWTDLLGSSVQTSQQIIDSYFSGSLSGVKLNIDYSDFNNFIFYSSATERLENFKYKLELIEYYTSQSTVVAQLSGSVATTNIADYETSKTNLISGFDGFEQYLYYQSSSKITTYEVPTDTPVIAQMTGSYVFPVPKTNSSVPYSLTAISSSQFTTWYDNLYTSASLYDSLNFNSLLYTVPEFIKLDQNNEGISSFVNMLGHHYDILYTYVNHMTKIYKREENPKLGMPNELLYSVAKQFGWNLTDGKQSQELWKYVLGTDEAGIPLTGSNTVGDPSVSGQNMTYTVWRRIVNNLPLLLKSKGTKRSIQALLSCYGIPQSIISINEYGGPRLERAPVYEKLNFDYALDLIGTTTGTVKIRYAIKPSDIEFRFRTDNVIANPTISSSMELFDINGGSVYATVDFVSGTKGSISLNGNTSTPIEMFDGGWLSVLITEDIGLNETYAIVKRSKYGKIVAETSVTASGVSIPVAGNTIIFGDSVNASRLQGQLQEIRLWNRQSSIESYFNNHVKAPAAYNSLDPYNELLFRIPLTQKINHTLTASLQGVQPVAASFTASFTGWSTSTPYDSIEETYYYDAPSLGAGTFDDNKIRLEDNELIGTLDVKTRAERSQFDKAPIDSKKLGVYFSPQTMIDEDIIAQYGYISLDEYIGDPGEPDSKSYPRLIQKAQEYWKKYANRNDINSYIKIFSLFDLAFFKQLEQLLPARTDKLVGVLVQPNLFERSKDKILPAIQRFDSAFSASLQNVSPTASGDYLAYTGSIENQIMTLTAEDDDQWQGYLTASQSEKYDGFPYSYDYLLRSGSAWITASTPYWISEATNPSIISSVRSEYRFISGTVSYTVEDVVGAVYGAGTYGTGSYAILTYGLSGSLAEVQDYIPAGIANHRFDGSKLNSPGFNINSTQTVDGGPVVEWRTTNPNQLIYQTAGEQGSFVLV